MSKSLKCCLFIKRSHCNLENFVLVECQKIACSIYVCISISYQNVFMMYGLNFSLFRNISPISDARNKLLHQLILFENDSHSAMFFNMTCRLHTKSLDIPSEERKVCFWNFSHLKNCKIALNDIVRCKIGREN